MELINLIMDSKILTIKEKLILIKKIKDKKIEKNELQTITDNLNKAENFINEKIKKGIEEIKTKEVKNMKTKIQNVKNKVTRIKIQTKETLSKQEEGDIDDILQIN